MDLKSLGLIILFGILGVLMRFILVEAVAPRNPNFPVGTLLVNLSGSLLIGFLYASQSQREFLNPELSKAVFVGLLGGYTTFSSFSLETLKLLEEGRLVAGVSYLSLSPLLGLTFAWSGAWLAKTIL